LADKARTAVLDVQILSRFDNDVFVTLDLLKSIGVVGKQVKSVKLIGNAALFNRLTLDKGIALSRGARESLLQQGGAARSE
jgi:ribosomal protein L15